MDPEKRRLIAAKGGKAVKAESRSFSKDRNLAKLAGQKGGRSVSAEKRSFALDRALAVRAGKSARKNKGEGGGSP
jgi:general stress protein YciG